MSSRLTTTHSEFAAGTKLRHHSGSTWEVIDAKLSGSGEWEGGMIAVAGDYRIRLLSLPSIGGHGDDIGKEMRVHADYLHGDGWRVEGIR